MLKDKLTNKPVKCTTNFMKSVEEMQHCPYHGECNCTPFIYSRDDLPRECLFHAIKVEERK